MVGEAQGSGRHRTTAESAAPQGAEGRGRASTATARRRSVGVPPGGRGRDKALVSRPKQRRAERPYLHLHLRIPLPQLSWRQQLFLFFLLSLLAVIAMLIMRPWVAQLGGWGYGGAFLISLLSNATVIFPAPGAAIIMVMAQDYNPLLLGIATGLGGSLGALTAYMAGAVGAQGLRSTRLLRLGSWAMQRLGGFLIFTFTLLPFLPMDTTSILAGATRYPFRRYLLWMGLAHILKMTALTYAAASYFEWIQRWLQPLG